MGGIIGACMFLLMLTTVSHADELLKHASIQPAAMGMASISEELGVESMAINPAGIHSQHQSEWVSGYTAHMQNAYTTAFSGVSITPVSGWSAGLVGALRIVDGIPETQGDGYTGTQVGSFSDTALEVATALAYRVTPRLSIAGGATLFQQSIADETASRLSLNLGIQYQSDLGRVGIAINNLLAAPTVWSTGRSDGAVVGYSVGYSTEIYSVRVMGGVSHQDSTQLNVGVSTQLADTLTVSAGVADITANWTTSLGVSMTLDRTDLLYAYQQNQVLGDSHKMGIKIEIL